MIIFNSLGSNYNLSYVFKSLFERSSDRNAEALCGFLEQRYGGKTILFYKGRQALSAALKILDFPIGSSVAINGFTCVAVYKAVELAGYTPVCLDLERDSNLNFSAEILEKTMKKNTSIKVVVVQNTFGYPSDIQNIERICKKNDLILIEDLAHCVGTQYGNGKEAGTVGDMTVLSFSQDKIIDAVSGGALVIRNKKYQSHKIKINYLKPKSQLKDRIYPLITYKIRSLYGYGVGKPYHFILRKLNLLSNIMNNDFYDFYHLPNWYCRLALFQFTKLGKQLKHRRRIAQIYAQNIDERLLLEQITKMIDFSSNLRFPILVQNRIQLVNYLKSRRVFVSDIWYDEVAPDCPVAGKIAKKILNLPTHINITEKQALKICELINLWQKLK